MKKLISESFATKSILFILSGIICFHLLITAGIIPFEIVWGGRLKNHTEMLQFEAVSIILNLIMVAVVAINAGLLKVNLKPVFLKISFWLMAILFSLNTIGNLIAINTLETLIFTPLTFILAVFSFRLAISNEHQPDLSTQQNETTKA
jgi:hypothetical protein